MVSAVSLVDFLDHEGLIIDSRSPSEYGQAHIPGSVNLPLLNDAERAVVGTLYKRQGRDAAIAEGLRCVGPKLLSLVTQAKAMLVGAPAKVLCWRGGMRSRSLAWLLETADIPTIALEGGYKMFRRYVAALWEEIGVLKPRLLVLGGMTGSGKTQLLEQLRQQGEQVLNLEALAQHRGSSYGALGMTPQLSHEQFENALAITWKGFDFDRLIWVEDESRMIGHCQIPAQLYACMQSARFVLLDRPLKERIRHLVDAYGAIPMDQLKDATQRLERRLGRQRTHAAIQAIEHSQLSGAVEIVLDYYDRAYGYGIKKHKRTYDTIVYTEQCQQVTADALLQWARKG